MTNPEYFGNGKTKNPGSAQRYIKTTGEAEQYLLRYIRLMCAYAFARLPPPRVGVHASSMCERVFKQDTNIDCSLIILPSALFKASITVLCRGRHCRRREEG